MISFNGTIMQFARQGEKTGWSYLLITEALLSQLAPGQRKSFRVKGRLDQHAIGGVALLPMGDGSFILPLNANMRKALGKRKGATVQAKLEVDTAEPELHAAFIECLKDDAEALRFFEGLPKGHQRYYSKWIESAKTEATQTKRIAQAINGLARRQDFGLMLRSLKQDRARLG